MGNFVVKIKSSLRQYKILLILLALVTVLAIVLGVIFALNTPSDVYEVNLSEIAYIKFLSGKSGLMSMMFKMWLSLLIFLILIIVCGIKRFLFPLGVVFYLYLVYSQVFVIMNVVFLYGFFSCLILLMLLIIYTMINSIFRGQKLYLIQGGSVMIELHLADGRTIGLQSGMDGVYPFLDHAFYAWCRLTGRDPDTCEFHDPSQSKWFPMEEDA